MKASAHRRRTGIQTHVLLQWVAWPLVLVTLCSVAVPVFHERQKEAAWSACRQNMKRVADAVIEARGKDNTTSFRRFIGSPVSPDNIQGMADTPVCPDGGTYEITTGSSGDSSTFRVICTAARHGGYDPTRP